MKYPYNIRILRHSVGAGSTVVVPAAVSAVVPAAVSAVVSVARMFFAGILFACTLFVGMVRPAPAAAQSGVRLARADSLYDTLHNREALEIYRELFAADSTDFQLLYRLSRTAGDLAKDVMAEDGVKEAKPLLEQSVSYAEQLRRLHPDRPETWFQLAVNWGTMAQSVDGRDKVKLGRDVEKYALEALRLDPSYAFAYLALGIFYREVGALNWVQRTFANTFYGGLPEGGEEKALKSLRKALELDPTLVMTHYELAVTYLAADDIAMARYHLGRAVSLIPINTEEVRQQAEAERQLVLLDANNE